MFDNMQAEEVQQTTNSIRNCISTIAMDCLSTNPGALFRLAPLLIPPLAIPVPPTKAWPKVDTMILAQIHAGFQNGSAAPRWIWVWIKAATV